MPLAHHNSKLMVPLLYCLRRGLGLKDGPGSARASTVSVWLRWWGSSSRHRLGQVLADLALRAKVVQTVGCSTFTRRAKPATRKVADSERMNPQGKGGAYAPIPRDDEHQGDEDPENSRTPDPAGSCLHQHGEPHTPS